MPTVSGNGNRQQTLRTNTTQPYEVGFLHEREHKDYNVSMYDELTKVSTATKHIFRGLDDVNKEVQERTKALDALGLKVSEDFKKVWFEFNGVKQQIGTGILLENIKDINGNDLSGILTGIQTDITGAKGAISQTLGEIDNMNQHFIGEILRIDATDASQTQEIGLINTTGGTHFQAVWGVKQTVGDLTSGFGLINDGVKPVFTVTATKFQILDSNNANYPLFVVTPTDITLNGVVKINQAQIKDLNVTNANISGQIQSNNYATGATGWAINKDTGNAEFSQVVVRGDVYANNGYFKGDITGASGTFSGDITGASGSFNGTVQANHIQGDLVQADVFPSAAITNTGGSKTIHFAGNPLMEMHATVSVYLTTYNVEYFKFYYKYAINDPSGGSTQHTINWSPVGSVEVGQNTRDIQGATISAKVVVPAGQQLYFLVVADSLNQQSGPLNLSNMLCIATPSDSGWTLT